MNRKPTKAPIAAPRPPAVAAYDHLLDDLHALIATARQVSIRAVNATMTATYWDIGRQLVEFEQGGRSRAAYGAGLLQSVSAALTSRHGRGFSVDNLERFRLFYQRFPLPEISATPSRKSRQPASPLPKSATPLRISSPAIQAWIERLSARLPLSWSHYNQTLAA